MNDHIDTRDGWRELPDGEVTSAGEVLTLTDMTSATGWRRWVREEPMPPLPTEEATLIQVQWADPDNQDVGRGVMLVLDDGGWVEVGSRGVYGPSFLAERITGFEVLAEPLSPDEEPMQEFIARVRRDNAKAIAKYLENMECIHGNDVRREFGINQ